MVAPCGSAIPGRSRTSTSTSYFTCASPARTVPVGQSASADSLVRFDVALTGLGHHGGRERRGRGRLVPTASLQEVAHGLLVEGGRGGPRLPLIGGPEKRRGGGGH